VDEFDISGDRFYFKPEDHSNLEHISSFIMNFDHGKYPKLEQKAKNKMKAKNKIKEIIKALRALGRTESAVVKKLTALRIKGYKEEGDNCPIANYLGRKIPSLKCNVVVDVSGCSQRSTCFDDVRFANHNLRHIGKFVVSFDSGEYPKLDKSPIEEDEVY
jgi:hypothetical protein